jgi:antitoxin FitA
MEKINISVKGIPMDVYEQIKKRAERNYRSINSEIIATLADSVESNRVEYETVVYNAKYIRDRAKGSLTTEEIQQAIEEGRE